MDEAGIEAELGVWGCRLPCCLVQLIRLASASCIYRTQAAARMPLTAIHARRATRPPPCRARKRREKSRKRCGDRKQRRRRLGRLKCASCTRSSADAKAKPRVSGEAPALASAIRVDGPMATIRALYNHVAPFNSEIAVFGRERLFALPTWRGRSFPTTTLHFLTSPRHLAQRQLSRPNQKSAKGLSRSRMNRKTARRLSMRKKRTQGAGY